MSIIRIRVFTMFVWLAAVQPVWAATPPACQGDNDAAGVATPLPRLAAVLKPGGTLHILAVGSATMFGPQATLMPGTVTSQAIGGGNATKPPPEAPLTPAMVEQAFPWQMAKTLEAMNPGLSADVVVRGGRGLSAADMLTLMKTELKAGKYELVLWQTGTVEAVRNTSPAEFAQTLAEGAEAVEAANANLVLIDPQYSRFLQTNSNLDPYAQALQQTASMPGVELFRRFDLMRSWVNDGHLDLERTPKADRRRTVETLHVCLGIHLARLVLAGAHL